MKSALKILVLDVVAMKEFARKDTHSVLLVNVLKILSKPESYVVAEHRDILGHCLKIEEVKIRGFQGLLIRYTTDLENEEIF